MAKWQVLPVWESWVCVATTKAECEEGELDASVARSCAKCMEALKVENGGRRAVRVGGWVGTSST